MQWWICMRALTYFNILQKPVTSKLLPHSLFIYGLTSNIHLCHSALQWSCTRMASDIVWLWWKVSCSCMFCDLLYLCASSWLVCPTHLYLNGCMYCRLVLWQGYQCYMPLISTFQGDSSLSSLSSPPIVCMDCWVSSWVDPAKINGL